MSTGCPTTDEYPPKSTADELNIWQVPPMSTQLTCAPPTSTADEHPPMSTADKCSSTSHRRQAPPPTTAAAYVVAAPVALLCRCRSPLASPGCRCRYCAAAVLPASLGHRGVDDCLPTADGEGGGGAEAAGAGAAAPMTAAAGAAAARTAVARAAERAAAASVAGASAPTATARRRRWPPLPLPGGKIVRRPGRGRADKGLRFPQTPTSMPKPGSRSPLLVS